MFICLWKTKHSAAVVIKFSFQSLEIFHITTFTERYCSNKLEYAVAQVYAQKFTYALTLSCAPSYMDTSAPVRSPPIQTANGFLSPHTRIWLYVRFQLVSPSFSHTFCKVTMSGTCKFLVTLFGADIKLLRVNTVFKTTKLFYASAKPISKYILYYRPG